MPERMSKPYVLVDNVLLQKLVNDIKTRYVQKETGKGLSSNDYIDADLEKVKAIPDNPKYTDTTYTEVTVDTAGLMSPTMANKLATIEVNADENLIERITRNNTLLEPDETKTVNIDIPVNLSELNNDTGYMTEAEVFPLVEEAGRRKYEQVTVLPDPTNADVNTIYLVPESDGAGFEEYYIFNGAWEFMGSTQDVDLTGFVKDSDMQRVTEAELDAMWDSAIV